MKLLWLSVAITCVCFYAEACQPGQKIFGGSCYQLLTDTMTWDQGDAACSMMGGALAVPDSLEENMFIWQMFKENIPDGVLWAGCHNKERVDKWAKSGGRGQCNFFHWAHKEPSNGAESCIQLWKEGVMDDTQCWKQKFIICEISAPPAVPTISCLQRYADARSSSNCLTGRTIKEFLAKGVIRCGLVCRGEHRCRSFNLRRGGPGEMMTCQLNDIIRNKADDKNIRLDNGCKYFNF